MWYTDICPPYIRMSTKHNGPYIGFMRALTRTLDPRLGNTNPYLTTPSVWMALFFYIYTIKDLLYLLYTIKGLLHV